VTKAQGEYDAVRSEGSVKESKEKSKSFFSKSKVSSM
jgi:hypothetical protein